jgi:hypothetical protein
MHVPEKAFCSLLGPAWVLDSSHDCASMRVSEDKGRMATSNKGVQVRPVSDSLYASRASQTLGALDALLETIRMGGGYGERS